MNLFRIMSQETGGTLLKSNVELDLTLEVLEAAPNFVGSNLYSPGSAIWNSR